MTETTFDVTDTVPPVEHPVPDPTQSRNTKSTRNEKKTSTRARSKPRQLTNADIDKIEKFYGIVGMSLTTVNGRAGVECLNNARTCAESWAVLAQDNENVRRVLLMVIEGGAWGAVITAHMPILFAFLPGEVRDRFGFLGNTENVETVEDESE